MKTVLVWVLMSISSQTGTISYSPPLDSLEECMRLQKLAIDGVMKLRDDTRYVGWNQCVQLRVVNVPKSK